MKVISKPRLRIAREIPVEQLAPTPTNSSTVKIKRKLGCAFSVISLPFTSKPRSLSNNSPFGSRRLFKRSSTEGLVC